MSEHPDIESLSAFHDGEAPELAEHVASCASCSASVDRLASITGALSAPVDALDSSVTERMIRRAMAPAGEDVDEVAAPEVPPVPLPTRKRAWAIVASAAAAVVVAGGLAGFLTRSDARRSTGAESASRPAADSAVESADGQFQSPPAAGGAHIPGGSPFDGGQLGDIGDDRALAARVDATIGSRDATTAAAAAPAEHGAAPRSRVGGTWTCDAEARSVDPAAGALVYVADALHDGAPAKVLGFAPSGGRPITLFLLAQDGCRVLETATLP